MLGDLGEPGVDARIVTAILIRGGAAGTWMQRRGVELAAVEDTFRGAGWS